MLMCRGEVAPLLITSNRFVVVALAYACVLSSSLARNFRVAMMPNGREDNCASCHVRPNGGGTRTLFGEAVNERVTRGGREEFWSPALAALDSDGDGVPNGLELGDPLAQGHPRAHRALERRLRLHVLDGRRRQLASGPSMASPSTAPEHAF